MKVSVIIPTYNEEKLLPATLQQLMNRDVNHFEIIVADGGSTDNTIRIANLFNCQVIKCKKKGRACQMNEAVQQAKGQYLVFLHADTVLSLASLSKIEVHLQNESLALGGFTSIMRGRKTQWFLSSQNYVKTYVIAFLHRPLSFLTKGYRILFGDQVMFCRKDDFEKAGGFDEQFLLMEDAELCLRMNDLGKIRQFADTVYSSDRRIVKWGMFPGYFRYLKILFWYLMRGNPSRFVVEYEDHR